MDPQKFVTQVQLSGGMFVQEQPSNIQEGISKLVRDESGRVLDIYPLLGNEDDLIVVCEFPNDAAALKAWYGLSALYGWRTQTNPSPSLETFQEIHQAIHQAGGVTSGTSRERVAR